MSYWQFVIANLRFLSFGVLLTLFSSFGQTFYVSVFGAEIRGEFDLSHGDFGAIYSFATLASAVCLVWVGRKIDDVSLRLYSLLVCVGLAGACLLLASASSLIGLGLALFALRLTGQGLMSHTSSTSMARYFDRQRGKAVSFAMLGLATGEALFPPAAVLLIAWLGWRTTWAASAIFVIVLLPPLIRWLLVGHDERHRKLVIQASEANHATSPSQRSWSRGEVLRDPFFYLVLPAAMAPAFIITGMFFHQVHLVETKGWSMTWYASCFAGYAAASVSAALLVAQLVDRAGTVSLLPYYLLPLAAGLLAIAIVDDPWIALFYMIAAGISVGSGATIVSSMWAEIYGVLHIGAIRSMTVACAVLATALAPVIMGWLIDGGFSMEAIALMCCGYIATGIALVVLSLARRKLLTAGILDS
ncbi:MAG: MFS transporter [Gammaproteobacteria bacterium]